MLKNRLQQILASENLDTQRVLLKTMAAELGTELLDLAAALMYLNDQDSKSFTASAEQKTTHQKEFDSTRPNFKLVRYRLDVGSQHQVTAEELKKILVDESGVDINNINNINIQSLHTLIDLPDNMPQDIFLHLKSVEINHHPLNIKRVKSGHNRKRGKNRSRRGRQRNSKLVHGASDQVNGG